MTIWNLAVEATGCDRAALQKARKLVMGAELPAALREALFEYLAVSKGPRFLRWEVCQVDAVVRLYFNGSMPEEQLAFEIRLMKAWRNDALDDFLEHAWKELTALGLSQPEWELLGDVLDLALDRGEVLKVFALDGLRVYYPLQPEKKRLQMLKNLWDILDSAPEPRR
jgi:hypothetical protein